MNIALMHYHLNPGGVTGVIRQQIESLSGMCKTVVLTGQRPPPEFAAQSVYVPGIGYDEHTISPTSAKAMADSVLAAIESVWPNGCDVLHIHNPLLAKNKNFLAMIDILALRGIRLFLQIHDFAEDGRPWSYYSQTPYPNNCHFGVINARDYRILEASGLSKAGLHKLFNPVTPFEHLPPPSLDVRFVLYPVRAIRRKNIGEAILLATYFAKDRRLAITLPPHSERDWEYYKQWRDYTRRHRFNVIFEASHRYDFKSLVSGADFLITTSISEGFGFAFLEPWTAGKALMGRQLDVCDDFKASGVKLDHLYDSLKIPFSWIDQRLFNQQRRDCFCAVSTAYGATPAWIETQLANLSLDSSDGDGWIDFGMLNEQFQKQVIDQVLTDRNSAQQLQQINPWLAELAEPSLPPEHIFHNRNIIKARYGIKAYRKRLMEIYEQIIKTPVHHRIDKQLLLSQFLTPERFSLLKWCNYAF